MAKKKDDILNEEIAVETPVEEKAEEAAVEEVAPTQPEEAAPAQDDIAVDNFDDFDDFDEDCYDDDLAFDEEREYIKNIKAKVAIICSAVAAVGIAVGVVLLVLKLKKKD